MRVSSTAVMVKLAEVEPMGIVTVVGMVSWELSLLTRVTVRAVVVSVLRVTVP